MSAARQTVRRIAEVEQTQPATGAASWAYRDYVYGPGYVDEVVAQVAFDGGTGAPPAGGGSGGGGGGSGGGGSGGGWVTYYYLQDANYNVVAVLSSEPGGSPPAAPVVLASFTYDPYGNVVFAEYAPTLPASTARALRLGHQGLFYERFYADPAESLLTDPPLEPGATGLYYNRNRWYSPQLGRFVSRDMNGTAIPIMTPPVLYGELLAAALAQFVPTGAYADGMNLFQYLRGNPVLFRDPAGLGTDYERHWLRPLCDLITWMTGGTDKNWWDSEGPQTVADVSGLVGGTILMLLPGGQAGAGATIAARLASLSSWLGRFQKVPALGRLGHAVYALSTRWGKVPHTTTLWAGRIGVALGVVTGFFGDSGQAGTIGWGSLGGTGATAGGGVLFQALRFTRLANQMAVGLGGMGGFFIGHQMGQGMQEVYDGIIDAIYEGD